MSPRRVVVLGGTGWLGRHVCAALAAAGDEVVVVARTPAAHAVAHRFVRLDLAAAPTRRLHDLLAEQRCDVVVNATDAANATDGWHPAEQALTATNVDLVEGLVVAVGSVARPCRLVHLGTIHEHGLAAAPERAHAYVRAKVAGSQAVLAAIGNGLDGCVLRIANVTGPHPSPASFPSKLVRLLDAALAAGSSLAVEVSQDRRDFVDVRDVARAVVAATTAGAGAVDVGSGVTVSMTDLVHSFAAAAGLPPDRLDLRPARVDSLGDAGRPADLQRAGAVLGWSPQVDLVTSLRDMLQDP